MKNYCKIYLSGSTKAPYDWVTSATPGISRLYIINDGVGGYIMNNTKIPFKKNCLYFYPAQIYYVKSYSSYETDNQRVDHSYINFEMIPPVLSNQVICIDPKDKPEYVNIINMIHELMLKSAKVGGFHNLDDVDKDFMTNTVIYIVNKLIKEENCEVVDDNVIVEVLNIMHENLSKKLSISQLAKNLNLTTEGLIKKFKKHLGVTPYSYLKNLRIRTALIMKKEGYLLSEIAEKCGYSDASALLHAIANEDDKN